MKQIQGTAGGWLEWEVLIIPVEIPFGAQQRNPRYAPRRNR